MKIGLIGAPGSGKSELAAGLAEKLAPIHIIDDYVDELERQMDVATGPWGGYLGNIWIALGRYARERVLRDSSSITCGTVIESAIYTTMYIARLDDSLNADEKDDAVLRVDATMRVMACMFLDAYSYDYVFYLPARQDREDDDVRFVDEQLQAAVAGFKLGRVTTLENRETQLADALKALERSESTGAI